MKDFAGAILRRRKCQTLPNIPKIDLDNIYLPRPDIKDIMKHFEADKDCFNYDFCKNLEITNDKICAMGGDKRFRCTFGDTRQLILLSRILEKNNHTDEK